MDAGLISKWDIFEAKCQLTAAYNRSGTQGVNATAQLFSEFATDAIFKVTGLNIVCYTEIANGAAAGAGTGYVQITIPQLGISETENYTGGWQTSLTGRIEADDLALYIGVNAFLQICWRLKWSEIRVYAGATLKHTESAGELECTYEAPAGIPLMGIPPILSASSSINPVPTLGATSATCALSHTYANATATAAGGWRFQEVGTGVWSTPPVDIDVEAIPGVTCAVTATTSTPIAADTWNGSVTAYMGADDETTRTAVTNCNECSNGTGSGWEFWRYDRVVTYEYYEGSVMLLPALSKSVQRWGGTDYKALIARYGFPWTKRVASASCFDYILSATTDSDSVTTEVHPELTTLLSTVGSTTHTIEDPLAEISLAPYTMGGFKYRGRGTCTAIKTIGSCPLVLPEEPEPDPPVYCGGTYADAVSHTVASQFEPLVQASSGAGANVYLLSALDHREQICRYVNFTCHPHWSYQYWFPGNTLDTDGDGEYDAQEQWEVFLASIANEYWLDGRSQWLSQSSLPGGENLQTRNSLVSAPLRDGALSLLLKQAWFGVETSWWGISRYQVRQFAPVANKALDSDSASLWSADHATLTHGANIVCNPDQAAFSVYLDIGSLTVEPYLYPHLAKQITVDWLNTNVSSMSVYLDSIDGVSSVRLATTQGTYAKPTTAGDAKYAGSWQQDFGIGYFPDLGSDSLASGISAATMADNERVAAFQLLAGQQAYRLRFECVAVDHTVDVTIKYPTFIAPTLEPYVYQEQGHHACIVWADGPGIRYGNWRWWNYVANSELTSPAIEPPGTRFALQGHKSSVLDALRYENLFALAAPYDDSVTSRIAALYDSEEGQTKAKAAYDTIAFLVKSNSKAWLALVNTWSEVPPLAVFCRRARNSDLAMTGSYTQEAWSMAQEPRRYVSGGQQVDLYDPVGATTWTSAEASPPSSWVITKHTHAVTNDESPFHLRVGGNKIAVVRPWHGTFDLYDRSGIPTRNANWVSYDVSGPRRHILAYADTSNNVYVARSQNLAALDFDETNIGVVATAGCIRWHVSDLVLWTVEAGSCKQRTSDDEGQTFSVATTIGAGTQVCGCIDTQRVRYVYRRTSAGAVVAQLLDAENNVIKADTTAIASGVDDKAIACDYRPLASGVMGIVLWTIESGTLQERYSTDGFTFS